MTLVKARPWFSLAVILCSCAGEAPAASELSATLTPSKDSYLSGEAIELRLTITNNGTEAAQFLAPYPSFEWGDGGIKLSLIGAPVPRAAKEPESNYIEVPAGKAPIVSVNPGTRWSRNVYAQRYLPGIPLGTHDIAYILGISLLGAPGTPGEPRRIIKAAGTITVTVLDGGASEVSKRIEETAKRFEAGNSSDVQEAAEALSVTDSPLVVPCLARLIKTGYGNSAVEALGKFRGEREAEDLLLIEARSRATSRAVLALNVMRKWNYPLAEDDLAFILSNGDAEVRLRALDFARSSNRRAYVPTISSYVGDPDARVATYSRLVTEALSAKGN
jgi:hypothetical protein